MDRKIIGISCDYFLGDEKSRSFYCTKREYVDAVVNAINRIEKDLAVILIPNQLSQIGKYIEMIDGLLVIGGKVDVHPNYYNEEILFDSVFINSHRNEFDISFVSSFLKTNKPIMGICAGAQVINVVCGGSLYQDIDSQIKTNIKHSSQDNSGTNSLTLPRHDIAIKANTRLGQILKSTSNNGDIINVNSSHHQGIKDVGNGLIVSASAVEDGVVECIEMIDHKFCIGVQWHPEIDGDSLLSCAIFDAFVSKI